MYIITCAASLQPQAGGGVGIRGGGNQEASSIYHENHVYPARMYPCVPCDIYLYLPVATCSVKKDALRVSRVAHTVSLLRLGLFHRAARTARRCLTSLHCVGLPARQLLTSGRCSISVHSPPPRILRTRDAADAVPPSTLRYACMRWDILLRKTGQYWKTLSGIWGESCFTKQ